MLTDDEYILAALRLARRGYGATSPNPMVGAILVKRGHVIGSGWHHRAGEPHAEIEAIRNARKRGHDTTNATLYVTLEPCCTSGRTPACTEAILAARISKVVVGAIDPNPRHAGKAYKIFKRAGIDLVHGVLAKKCELLNEAFNHWIVTRIPFVTVKAAMTMDGKIATAACESKWITSAASRSYAMKLRQGADAILVGINTLLADDPNLTDRGVEYRPSQVRNHPLRRIVLDAKARTPLSAKVVRDQHSSLTTIVVTEAAPANRVAALSKRVRVLKAPKAGSVRNSWVDREPCIDLHWLLCTLGNENVTSLLVEGGGEVNASFLLQHLAHRVTFFYAPKVLGGRNSVPSVGGKGASGLDESIQLSEIQWRRLGPDLLLTARLDS